MPNRASKESLRRKARGLATMAENNKAGYRVAHGSGSSEKWLTANQRRFFLVDYRHFVDAIQCQYCGSDYVRIAINGYCQRALSRFTVNCPNCTFLPAMPTLSRLTVNCLNCTMAKANLFSRNCIIACAAHSTRVAAICASHTRPCRRSGPAHCDGPCRGAPGPTSTRA